MHLGLSTIQGWYQPNNNLGIQRFSHLVILTEYQYLTGIAILILVE